MLERPFRRFLIARFLPWMFWLQLIISVLYGVIILASARDIWTVFLSFLFLVPIPLGLRVFSELVAISYMIHRNLEQMASYFPVREGAKQGSLAADFRTAREGVIADVMRLAVPDDESTVKL